MQTVLKVDRLSRLASLLEHEASKQLGLTFDLRGWGRGEERRGGFLWLSKNICHTAACAVGLACLSGVFIEDGLSYIGGDLDGPQIVPAYGDATGWPAAEAFFGLTEDEADHLFNAEAYDGAIIGPKAERAVAERIRDFLQAQAVDDAPSITIETVNTRALRLVSAA